MAYANNKQIIADGRITLYQRDDVKDAIWQCRIPFKGVRGYIKRTTGEKDFYKAAVFAIKLLGEIEHRIITDQPLPLVCSLLNRHSSSTAPVGPSTLSRERAATSQTLIPAQ